LPVLAALDVNPRRRGIVRGKVCANAGSLNKIIAMIETLWALIEP
jgi:hypothetical protein